MAKYITKKNGAVALGLLFIVIVTTFFRKSIVEGHGGGGGGGGGRGGGGRGGGGRGGGGRGGGGWTHGYGYGPGVGSGGGAIAFNPLYYGRTIPVYYVEEPVVERNYSYNNTNNFWQGFLGGSFIVAIIITIYNIYNK
jgi:hypothetical protein